MYTHKQPKPESTLDLTAASFLEARAELRSLSIPGTYQEKITHLGNSLMNLTGLKSLDLSRNSLVSLEGIQYLLALQSLNLYYNCVSSLAEVLRLHPLTELVDVDLRLNPVVRSESDYRLFVVHMLPRLRQLDDRPVRESERKASQLHFASEDSLDTKESCLAAVGVGRPGHLRGRCAHTPASACLAMDADDEAVLNLIAECEWDLSNPPGSASSTQECEADCYSPKVAFSKPEPRYPLSPQSMQHQRGDSTQGHRRRKSHPRGRCPEKTLQNPCSGEPEASCLFKPRAHFTPYPDSVMEDVASSSQKSSLSTWQVSEPLPTPETCRKTRGPGGRAQECPSHLGRTSGPPSPEGSLSTPRRSESRSEGASSRPEASETDMQSQSCGVSASDCGEPPPACSPARPRRKATPEAALLQALLNLVDGYWGSHRPLQSHATFLVRPVSACPGCPGHAERGVTEQYTSPASTRAQRQPLLGLRRRPPTAPRWERWMAAGPSMTVPSVMTPPCAQLNPCGASRLLETLRAAWLAVTSQHGAFRDIWTLRAGVWKGPLARPGLELLCRGWRWSLSLTSAWPARPAAPTCMF
ncbi:centrosomal protein of 72 kDa isoform X3 [Tupaia chinensis]|uniref:centrosomal protein of 72 kDa isoform X3 n=1 Tax=Tupaia chinensis TaxID=246437 RepID=UPI000FFC8D03|nr:centrosomal protein of 72 kDa isoform X3 [Tupaia chinensis]